ncbi:pyridoxal phosphate-dependent decarboxylase family protein [Pseudomonas sp. GM80]|uniref:pyridoxal phosphate-dependent decarboxylase family protein n=1 Tax=Pseudomonas sp. GM80 TaxID=1144339 RepID=UPI00026FD0D5|nr:aminotransferase class V-fold PLP-dependent enzyme [Pseudomonas sp. GM80]EJN34361.1 PLP-dependent enzyme, glutamate decarboxylase [Pseudomonas sp. GM80]
MKNSESELVQDADARALTYLEGINYRRVFPNQDAIDSLSTFNESLADEGRPGSETLAMLDDVGSAATVATNGPRYFGFVVGAALPIAAAAERLMLAWDNGSALYVTSPTCATLEEIAGRWMLDILDLPKQSAVGFGTSATACSLTCLTAARRALLIRAGWNPDEDGLYGAPEIRVVVSEKTHITILKALRILGFGSSRLLVAPVDEHGRIDPARMPALDDKTIVCLQAGEVNTGEFDPFNEIIPKAREAGAWIHIDGAFGLWARASGKLRHYTDGVEGADSWTVDGHKWLNTPYDCAMAICKDPSLLAAAMNSDAAYAAGTAKAQKNLTIEFSRRARGVPVWAILRTLGRQGVAEMVERHCSQATHLADSLRDAGFDVINRVVLNQVIVRGQSDAETQAIQNAAHESGEVWFGMSSWGGKAAFRLSISSWRTTDDDIERLIKVLIVARSSYQLQQD